MHGASATTPGLTCMVHVVISWHAWKPCLVDACNVVQHMCAAVIHLGVL